jgi:hypothetical protein
MIISGAHVSDLWLPGRYDVFAWSCGLLALTRNVVRAPTNRLVQDPCHAIHKELEILRSVQTPEEMPEEVLRRRAIASFGYGVQYQHQKQL